MACMLHTFAVPLTQAIFSPRSRISKVEEHLEEEEGLYYFDNRHWSYSALYSSST